MDSGSGSTTLAEERVWGGGSAESDAILVNNGVCGASVCGDAIDPGGWYFDAIVSTLRYH